MDDEGDEQSISSREHFEIRNVFIDTSAHNQLQEDEGR